MVLSYDTLHANFELSWQDEALHFYIIFSATFVDFLLFTLVHWQTLNFLHSRRKWQSSLMECVTRCFMIAVLALMFLVIGWRVSEIRRLLLDVSIGSLDERQY